MALIVKCRACSRRMPRDATACPACGHASNVLIIDYRPHGRNGKRVRLKLPESIVSPAEAQEIERSLKAARHRKREDPLAPQDATVDQMFPDYLAWYRLRRSPRTVEDLEYTHRRHISRIIGAEQIAELNIAHVNLYQTMRKIDGVANRTINKELDYLSGFLRWCRDTHAIPCGVPRDRLPAKRPIPIVLTADEVARIIEAAAPLYRAFFLCLYSLGLRKAEARLLKWHDFDFEGMSLRVLQKGGSFKALPVPGILFRALEALPRYPEGMNPAGYVFFNPVTRKPIFDVRDAIRRACKAAGVCKKVTPHLFRHSVATHMMERKVNLRIIQLFLGHTAIGTTQWYTHVGAESLRDAQDQIELPLLVHAKPQ